MTFPTQSVDSEDGGRLSPTRARVLQLENEREFRTKGRHARGYLSLCFAFPYNIRCESSSTGAEDYEFWVSAPAAIRNAICGVLAAQKITTASFNEPYTRDILDTSR